MIRRKFTRMLLRTIGVSIASLTGLGVFAGILKRKSSPNPVIGEPEIIRPPGALESEADFLSQCIRCARCRDACPTGAIQLGSFGDPAQLGTPYVLPFESGCNLSLACTTTCPTDALQLLTLTKDVNMGLAVVDERTCVSINGTGVCGACHTACPFKNEAITQGLRNAPTVHEDHCVGCGLCEEACIVDGIKAIRVFSGRELV
ncbi:MAG: 4Fe-4S dicluster domain-containing protein [Verrucomicrobiales bacterium]|nr:4Fe-4S dicluster domain-containing protein [Verrucomicrobiales bacterium]